jgi:hypothetical protein
MKEETKAVVPHSFEDVKNMAVTAAQSRLFGTTDVNQMTALMLIAQAEGLHPMIAARRYHVIQGRPTMKAEAMLAEFQRTGGKVEWDEHSAKRCAATFSHPTGSTVDVEWTVEKAKSAGLVGKDNWKNYPENMLHARVVSDGVRWCYPQAVQGLYTPEEIDDMNTPPVKVTIETENGTEEITTPDNRPKAEKVADMVLQNPEPAKEEPQVPQEAKQSDDIEDAQEITKESLIESIRSKRGVVGDDIFKSSMKGCGLTGKLTLQDLPINTLAELDTILEDAVKEAQG